jgi:hypothetical protein
MPVDQPTATIIASIIAAVLSGVAAILAYRTARAQQRLQKEALRAEEANAARSRLRELLLQMNRADTSIRRLAELMPGLEDSRVVEEAMATFSVVATFFDASAEHQMAAFEETIRNPIKEARERIGRFILALDMTDRKAEPAQSAAVTAGKAIRGARSVIERCTIVPLS